MHPLLQSGYEVGYDENLILSTEDEGDSVYHFKIAQFTETENPEIRIEITKESDIYYVAFFVITPEDFPRFIKKQSFRKCRYENFAQSLSAVLENARTNRSSFSAIFNNQILEIKQHLEFKTVGIFKIEFGIADRADGYVVDQAQYRYHRKITDFNDRENQLKELLEHVEMRNPQLAAQLRKGLKFGK
ncbi:hypothetical protein TRFO_28761 [Tritrichomonas foetus]|uniref:Spindle assembly abnormal protein 6 N-terminal domain-containing protein n=1 Tax=Tritrichomonas foetus TaxID=1144522 RepID=A0A1J4JYZ7_9EUKA|nr:hypothetical protein TRFO_28761 [Tritrichomonas foetus]|eukprot:OHT03914.1 hypothetical protein TRFO_28761 [Tritrichomonas foetus]